MEYNELVKTIKNKNKNKKVIKSKTQNRKKKVEKSSKLIDYRGLLKISEINEIKNDLKRLTPFLQTTNRH